MSRIWYIFFICSSINGIHSGKLPNGIEPCKMDDKECLKKSTLNGFKVFKEGVKVYGLPSIEPIRIDFISLVGNGRSIDIDQNYTDLVYTGMRETTLSDIDIDLAGDNCHIKYKYYQPKAAMVGQHSILGKLLFFQMKGAGDFSMRFVNLTATNDIECKKMMKNGKLYIEPVTYKLIFGVPDHLEFYFENVVQNNKQLSDQINKVAADNWVEIYTDLKDNFAQGFSVAFNSYIKRFFSKIPIDELFVK